MNRCPVVGRTGFGCSEPAGHRGDHVARNTGVIVDRWPPKPAPAKGTKAK